MKKLAILSAIALPFLSFADGGVSLLKLSGQPGTYYATTWKIRELTHVLKTNATLDVLGFVGTSARNLPVTGFALSAPIKLSDQVTINIGPAVAISGGKPVDIGGFAGITWRF